MAVMRICKYGEPVLQKKCKLVKKITPEIKKLIADMKDTMYFSYGVGLAANQVGEPVRICIIDTEPAKRKPMVLINPRIVDSKGKVKEEEGCLSFPGVLALVKRYKNVKVEAINEEGFPIVIDGEGLLAKALQHELDHLDGKTFLDRMTVYRKLKLKYEIKQRKKQGKW